MPWSIPYATGPRQAYWGAPNSNANFCEEDHIVSIYIAEFISTLTNALYVFYAAEGISRNAHRPNALLDCMPYIGLAGVGITSALFHTLLGYYSQMADDLSMLFVTGIVLHRIVTVATSTTYTILVGVALTAFLVILSYVHCATDEIIMHSITFGTMIVIIGLKTMRLLRTIESPLIRKRVTSLTTAGSAVLSTAAFLDLIKLKSAVIFVSGFVLWLLDARFCTTLVSLRHSLGMPWSFALELHGWWHIFTAIGAYIFIVLVEYLTTEAGGSEPAGRYAWPTSRLLGLAEGPARGAHGKKE